jgi:4-aminobutyrate aminotransferase-like enzyme/Ser/Thr protein kinase RdoA (MazF antagonist)
MPDQRAGAGVPALSLTESAALAASLYDLDVTAFALPSERDQNVLLTDREGTQFVLKIANANESYDVLEAECALIAQVASSGLCPQVRRTTAGARIGSYVTDSTSHYVRVITALPGVPLGRAGYQSPALLRDVGRSLGVLNQALVGFEHPAFDREFHWDLARALDVVHAHSHLVRDPVVLGAIHRCTAYHERFVAPQLAGLRRSVIHGDANDYNVLVDAAATRVTGLIDFGDAVSSYTVNDVAIAMAYASLSADDPLAAALHVLAGFHAALPLMPAEIDVVFSLMRMRLCVSACLAAVQRSLRPEDAYLGISQGPIGRVLPALAEMHPRFARYCCRNACGLSPVPDAPAISQWITENARDFAPIVGVVLDAASAAHLDFSAGSALIASDAALNAPALLQHRVSEFLAARGVSIGVGGYDEARLIYHWPHEPQGGEPRTVHIGVDISVATGTPLFAPLDGTVHAFEDADAYHDYGPMVVLRHETTHQSPLVFYTMYGHLTRDSLSTLAVGATIRRGEEFARVGSAPTNGNWWPHVHVQLITDMLDVPCNVNGAVRASQRTVWHSVFPDPSPLLGIPAALTRHVVSTPAVAAQRKARIGSNLSVSYGAQPLHIVRGAGQYLFDANGHRYIDAYNNVAHVGHAHPRVVRAVAEQLSLLNTNTRYLQHQLTEYAESLVATLPPSLTVCYFTASGSEANELALRLAREYTGHRDLLVMDAAYHGHTTTLIDISPYKHAGPGGRGAPEWVHTTPIPDVYRDRAVTGDPGAWFAARVGDSIARVHAAGRGVCGFIAETCPSVGGQIIPPTGYLADVYRRVRAAGGVCIADEVQTGFGRIGAHFWAFEQHGVTPDIVVLGKPIANGYPMGAVITTREIADRFDNGMEYFSTFGGSTVACVAAAATLRVVQEEQLQSNALNVGTRLLHALRSEIAPHALVGDVRGSGLFLGVELVRDRETREPAPTEATFVVNRLRARGVLAGTDGPYHNVIKLRGPMTLSAADADHIVTQLDRALHEVPPRL